MPKIKVFLADDHQILIDGVYAVLKNYQKFEIVGFALDGEILLDKIYNQNIDILVMDINMPKKDGIEVLKEFEKRGFPCKVIILSSYDSIKLIKEVLKLGVSGYLSKECAGENIVEAIETVARGKEYFSENIRENMLLAFTKNSALDIVEFNNNIDTIHLLTDREIEVLKLIAQEYSTKEIASDLSISNSTVETHRKNLMKKLQVKSTVGLVKFAIKNNLVK